MLQSIVAFVATSLLAPAYMRFSCIYSIRPHGLIIVFGPILTCSLYELATSTQNFTTMDPSVLLDGEIIKKYQRSLTPWELPSLLTPLHVHHWSRKKPKRERTHFPAIIGFVYRNRFAVASQIQRRFSKVLASDRTTRRHLEELQALGYLGVAPGQGLGRVFPKVYYVTGRGVKRLQESLAAKGKSWQAVRIDRRSRHSQEGYAADRIIHEIMITEFLLALWQTVEGRPDLELLTVQRRSLAKHQAYRLVVGGRPTCLVPDALFLFRQKGGGMCCCFLELDNGTMNIKQIRAKYARYAAWSRSPSSEQYLIDLYRRYGAAEPRPTFRLLVVARSRTGLDDEARLAELLVAARHVPSTIRDRLWFSTVAALASHQHDAFPLEGKFWLRARDLEWSSISGAMQQQIGNSSRHALFPLARPDALAAKVI